jgi:hypothetical protein
MGKFCVDKYSLLHFAVGIIFRFLNFNFMSAFFIHLCFEIFENSRFGVNFIDTSPLLQWWPGGKKEPDSIVNSIFDQVFFMIGWSLANQFEF